MTLWPEQAGLSSGTPSPDPALFFSLLFTLSPIFPSDLCEELSCGDHRLACMCVTLLILRHCVTCPVTASSTVGGW